jgi:hypothetical protein
MKSGSEFPSTPLARRMSKDGLPCIISHQFSFTITDLAQGEL